MSRDGSTPGSPRVSVRDVIEHGDFDAFVGTLAPDVVWIGIYPDRDSAVEAARP